jgi:hypothetical protein
MRPSEPRKTRATGGSFRVDDSTTATASAQTGPAQPAAILSALIELQDAAPRDQERRRKIAAAQWTLSLLDRLRVSLLEGRAADADLDALAAASVRGEIERDPALQSALDDVALRARVELAKRGR